MYGGYSDDDYDYEDYNPLQHMMDDPVHFQMYGYGGFGYDTSHVPRDEPEPPITKKAAAGDLAGVMAIVDKTSVDQKAQVINHARRWTEVDYRMSGFTKEYEWFGLTPVAHAASFGHDHIVQYLLEQGADPTLSGCPTDDVHVNAFGATESLVRFEERKSKDSKTPPVSLLRAKRCEDLLAAAKPFWKSASYSHSRYGKTTRKNFTNEPTDMKGLLDAIGAIPTVPGDESRAEEAKKKSKAAPTKSNAPSRAPRPSNASGGTQHLCAECKEWKSKSGYSKNQWSKGYAGKCKDCIESTKKPAAV